MRQKPKHVRSQWAFWSAAGATSALALVWLVYLPGKIDRIAAETDVVESPQGNFSRLFDSMKANISDSFADFATELSSTTEALVPETTDTDAVTATTSAPADSNFIDFNTFFEMKPYEENYGGQAAVGEQNGEHTNETAPDSESQPEHGAAEDAGTGEAVSIDNASTTSTAPVVEPAAAPRRVLIGTTSSAASAGAQTGE